MAKRKGALGPNICGEWIVYTIFISETEEVWLDHSKNTEHSMIWSTLWWTNIAIKNGHL